MQVKRLELYTSPEGTPGDLGLKITGQAPGDETRLARVWLRRKSGETRQVWNRYLAPVPASRDWEVRLHLQRGTGAMTRVDFTPGALAELAEGYAFPKDAAAVATLQGVQSDDPVYTMIKDWVLQVTSA